MATPLVLEPLTRPQSSALREVITVSGWSVIRANNGWFEPIVLVSLHQPTRMCRTLANKGYLVESRTGKGYKLRDGIAEAIHMLVDEEEE